MTCSYFQSYKHAQSVKTPRLKPGACNTKFRFLRTPFRERTAIGFLTEAQSCSGLRTMLPQNETKYKPVPTLSEPALSSPRLKAGASRAFPVNRQCKAFACRLSSLFIPAYCEAGKNRVVLARQSRAVIECVVRFRNSAAPLPLKPLLFQTPLLLRAAVLPVNVVVNEALLRCRSDEAHRVTALRAPPLRIIFHRATPWCRAH